MYFPYFRGKQNELILLRDNSELISSANIIPVIEPVKLNVKPLMAAFNSLIDKNAEFIIVANPMFGDFSEDNSVLHESVLNEHLKGNDLAIFGYILTEDMGIDDVTDLVLAYPDQKIALIHYGFLDGAGLNKELSDLDIEYHIFIDDHAPRMYRKRFKGAAKKILVEDGFKKKDSNRKYPDTEHFSDLHVTYSDDNTLDGFGDFLISGMDFSESGGPAYAIAIHLTFIDPDMDDDMYINHYKSDRNSTPADPGGKFLEALDKLVSDLDREEIFKSKAVGEYKKLHSNQHFPGLGIVKKLSMQHHVELMADFLKGQS